MSPSSSAYADQEHLGQITQAQLVAKPPEHDEGDDIGGALARFSTLARFVEEAIAPGSIVLTGGWHSFRALSRSYEHRPTVIGDPKNAAKQLPRVHRTFANLKTWLLGTHHGVRAKHLPYYVDEIVFRFNRRRTPMAAFHPCSA